MGASRAPVEINCVAQRFVLRANAGGWLFWNIGGEGSLLRSGVGLGGDVLGIAYI